MADDKRTTVDMKGKTHTLVRASCSVCKQCWKHETVGTCIYGGPFAGYQEVKPK